MAERNTRHADSAGRRGFQASPRLIGAVIVVVAAVWFILANRQHASIHLWVTGVSAPLWLVLLVTFLAGMLTGWLLSRRRGR